MKFDLLKHTEIEKAQAYFERLVSRGAKIELKKFIEQRTGAQNRYVHVIFAILGDYTGNTIEEVKQIVKPEFGRHAIYEKDGRKFLRSTASWNKMECLEFIDWYRQFCMEQGCYIPTPEEYYQAQWEIERQLQHML